MIVILVLIVIRVQIWVVTVSPSSLPSVVNATYDGVVLYQVRVSATHAIAG